MNKLVLVIGSNSFAGSNFINFLLNKNCRVLGISRSNEYKELFLRYKTSKRIKNFKFYKMDLNKDLKKILILIKTKKPKYIVNFSAQGMVAESWIRPLDWYETNLISQTNLVENLKHLKFLKKFIQFSTPEVYGNTKSFQKENFNFNPTTPYANSRASIDFHLRNLFKAYKFPVIFTRTANIYGPGQQIYRIVPKTILSAMLKKKLPLHGNGQSFRSFIYIDDVSKALFKILFSGKIGETYHISTNNLVSIKKLVLIIFKKLGVDQKLFYNVKDRIGKDMSYKLSSNKLRKKFGWKPLVSLDDGLNETYNWIFKNINFLKKIKKNYKHKK